MDVVRTNLKKLNGTVELDSDLGVGTTVRLRLPLTLAILPVLLVRGRVRPVARRPSRKREGRASFPRRSRISLRRCALS